MSRSIHFASRSIQGYGPPDGSYLPCSGISVRAVSISSNSSRADCRLIAHANNISYRRCASRSIRIVCNASSRNYRRNSDFSRQNKYGFSRNRNRHGEERDSFDDFEESESFSSKNGPLLSDSGNRKGQTAATPGPREKAIVELFRKVQAQLRERTALKEEKRVEDSSPVKSKESETVDSLLKLLRKHSVQQGRKNSTTSASTSDFILDRSKEVDPSAEESSDSSLLGSERAAKQEMQGKTPSPVVSRPKSNFQKRSPVPEIKFKPIYPEESVNRVSQDDLSGRQKKKSLKLEANEINELYSEPVVDPTFPEGEVFDVETSDDEADEIYDIENGDEAEEQNQVVELGEMKLVELRALAKSRGLKGYSKLKKNELVQLLSGSSR